MATHNVQRGDIYWVKIPPSHTVGHELYKRRPWLVVSHAAISQLNIVIGVPLSSSVNKQNRQFRIFIPSKETTLLSGSTMDARDRIAETEQVRCLSIERLEFPRQGYLSAAAMGAVEAGLAFVQDIR